MAKHPTEALEAATPGTGGPASWTRRRLARPPPARPLLGAALAVAAGSWLGSVGDLSSALRGLALGAIVVAFLRGLRGPLLPQVAPLGLGWLLVLGGAAGLRPTSAAFGGAGWAWDGDPLAFEGTWHLEREGIRDAFGNLGAQSGGGRAGMLPLFRVPSGAMRAGERVRILALRAPEPERGAVHAATVGGVGGGRGEVDARAQRRVRLDELVRLSAVRSGATIARLRATVAKRLEPIEDLAARALVRALVLGDTGELTPELKDRMSRCGLRHLLAVSGWHVGCLAWIALAPIAACSARALRRLGASSAKAECAALAISTAGVLLYVAVSGAAAPVRRAGLALVLARGVDVLRNARGRKAYRADALSLWSCALLAECAVDPAAARALSVQLSYSATLGLVLLSGSIERLFRARRDSFARDWPSAGPRALAGALASAVARACGRAVGAGAAAVLATLPIVWFAFGEWSPIGVLATALCVPFCAFFLLGGTFALIAPQGLGSLDPQPALAGVASLWLALVAALDALPGTPLPLPARPPEVVALLVLATGAVLRGSRGLRAAALAWALVLVPWAPRPGGLEIAVLDVGHGTAVAWRAPGEGLWIFDAGSRDRGRVGPEVLGPLLARWEGRRPAIVLSHADRDHTSALAWLVERYPPRLWAGALPAPLGERLPHTSPRFDLERGTLRLPSRDRRTTLILRRGLDVSGNEGSRSLEIDGPAGRVFLFGDAEEEGMRRTLDTIGLGRPAAAVLIPHHGSEQRFLGPLLELLSPAEVWISASREPALGPELERREARWSWTGRDGSILRDYPARPETEGAERGRHGTR